MPCSSAPHPPGLGPGLGCFAGKQDKPSKHREHLPYKEEATHSPKGKFYFLLPSPSLLQGGWGKERMKRIEKRAANQSTQQGAFENLYCNASKSCVWACLTREIHPLMDGSWTLKKIAHSG
ncbi:hypothetical protein HJG60_009516 [Phyllostomus discolor]|uniref:Uncharacterized protein n=1 Tax=Phyllostomus discolor TaxID=89673 RepID=A0A833YIN1_9CHIR|nr:hypothetical protein HJG60_009516 [Phyllostomus discolor]